MGGISATKLYERHTQEELLAMMRAIEADETNRSPPGAFWKYIPTARKKLDMIARAISFHSADKRAAAGNPVKADGYSGRQTNRR